MAEVTSAFYDAITGTPPTLLDGRQFNAQVVAYRIAHPSTDFAENDTLKLFKLYRPMIPQFIMVDHGAFGSSVTLDIGDNASTPDPDRFVVGLDISAAGRSINPVLDQSVMLPGEELVASFLDANPDAAAIEVTVFGLAI